MFVSLRVELMLRWCRGYDAYCLLFVCYSDLGCEQSAVKSEAKLGYNIVCFKA